MKYFPLERIPAGWWISMLLLTTFLASCDTEEIFVEGTESQLPATVQLQPGQSVRFHRQGIAIRFENILSDSRCPEDANCIWAGDAAAAFTFRLPGNVAEQCTLHTTLEPKKIVLKTMSLELRRVDPYPKTLPIAEPPKYVVTLLVESTAKL